MNHYPLRTKIFATWQIAKMAELSKQKHGRRVREVLIRLYILTDPRCIQRTKKFFKMTWLQAWRHVLYQWRLIIMTPSKYDHKTDPLDEYRDPYEYYGD